MPFKGNQCWARMAQLESPHHAQLGQGEHGLGLNTGGSRRCGSHRLSANHTPGRRLSPEGRPSTPYSYPLANIFSQVILDYFLFLPYGVFWWEGALHLNADKFITILYSLSCCVFRYYCLLSDPESFLYFLLDVLKSCFSKFSPLIKWVVFGFVSLHGLLNSQRHFLNNSSFLYRFACCLWVHQAFIRTGICLGALYSVPQAYLSPSGLIPHHFNKSDKASDSSWFFSKFHRYFGPLLFWSNVRIILPSYTKYPVWIFIISRLI